MSSAPVLAALALAGALLGGCAGDPPPVPPTELTPITASVTLAREWEARVGEAGRGRFEPYADAERVVVADAAGEVRAFDRRSGARLWERDLDTRLTSGVGGADGRVYVGTARGEVRALDAATGEPSWRAEMSSEVLVPPAAGFGAVVVRSVDGRVVALEPESGEERWSVSNTPPALTLTGYARPLLLDGGVLVGLDDGRLLALNLENGRTIWEAVLSVPSGRSEVERLVDVDADPVIDARGIYVVNYQGKAARLEPARGQLVWSVPMSSVVGLALAGERVVVVDEEDVLHGLDSDSGRELWKSEALKGRRLGPPATLAGGGAGVDAGGGGGEDLLIGDAEGYVHVVSAADGTLVGRARPAKAPIRVRPAVDGGSVLVEGSDGRVAAYSVARSP